MLSALKELIPGAERWPRFVRNRSEQYEARLALVRVPPSNSVLLARHARVGAADRGRARRGPAEFDAGRRGDPADAGQVTLQYVDNREQPTQNVSLQSERLALGLAGCAAPTAGSPR